MQNHFMFYVGEGEDERNVTFAGCGGSIYGDLERPCTLLRDHRRRRKVSCDEASCNAPAGHDLDLYFFLMH
jgi:hypothetical protein